jgi:hypothetical protein
MPLPQTHSFRIGALISTEARQASAQSHSELAASIFGAAQVFQALMLIAHW